MEIRVDIDGYYDDKEQMNYADCFVLMLEGKGRASLSFHVWIEKDTNDFTYTNYSDAKKRGMYNGDRESYHQLVKAIIEENKLKLLMVCS